MRAMKTTFRLIRRSSSSASFLQAKEALARLPNEPTNEEKLQLYALYKQGTTGPPQGSRPGFLDPVGRAKFDAWYKVKSMAKEEAQNSYVSLVIKLNDGKALTASEPTSSSSTTTPSLLELQMSPRQPGVVSALNLETISTILSPSGILTARLNRPTRGNAFNMQMWADWNSLFAAVNKDSETRVVVVTGSEASFSTGMDLSVFSQMQALAEKEQCQARKREALAHVIDYFSSSVSLSETCRVPVLAAISGSCIGGAVDIATACDLRFCTENTVFSVKEIDLAIVADIGTLQRLPKLIGEQRARDLSYTGRNVSGKEAFEMGLVLAPPFKTEAEMLKAVHDKAEVIASKSPLTIRGIKSSLNFSRDHSVAEGLDHVKMHNAALLYSSDLLTAMTGGKTFKGV